MKMLGQARGRCVCLDSNLQVQMDWNDTEVWTYMLIREWVYLVYPDRRTGTCIATIPVRN